MADILWLIVALVNFLCAALFANKGDAAKTILYCFNTYIAMQAQKKINERRNDDG